MTIACLDVIISMITRTALICRFDNNMFIVLKVPHRFVLFTSEFLVSRGSGVICQVHVSHIQSMNKLILVGKEPQDKWRFLFN